MFRHFLTDEQLARLRPAYQRPDKRHETETFTSDVCTYVSSDRLGRTRGALTLRRSRQTHLPCQRRTRNRPAVSACTLSETFTEKKATALRERHVLGLSEPFVRTCSSRKLTRPVVNAADCSCCQQTKTKDEEDNVYKGGARVNINAATTKRFFRKRAWRRHGWRSRGDSEVLPAKCFPK